MPRHELSPVPIFMLHASAATFLCTASWEMPATPLPLSVCNLAATLSADIDIDIETAEKVIGEIIVQPLR